MFQIILKLTNLVGYGSGSFFFKYCILIRIRNTNFIRSYLSTDRDSLLASLLDGSRAAGSNL